MSAPDDEYVADPAPVMLAAPPVLEPRPIPARGAGPGHLTYTLEAGAYRCVCGHRVHTRELLGLHHTEVARMDADPITGHEGEAAS